MGRKKMIGEILDCLTGEDLSKVNRVVNKKLTLEEIEKFYKTCCQKVSWVERLRSYDYSYFLRSYLIPPAFIWVADNQISLLHGMVLLLAKKSLRDKQKVIIFPSQKKDFVLKLLYLAFQYLWFLRDKKKYFEWLKKERIVVSWRDFANLVQSSLVDWERDKERFQGVMEVLPFLLKLYKVGLKEDESVEGIKIKVFVERGDHEREKKETPP